MSNILPSDIHRDLKALLNAKKNDPMGETFNALISELDVLEARELLKDAITILAGAGIMWTTPAGMQNTINCNINNQETEAEYHE